jgi:hypothetical protein
VQVLLSCSLLLALIVAMNHRAQSQVAGQKTGGTVTTPTLGASEKSPLDEPISWIRDAKRNYTAVKDYTCTLVTRERIKGVLHEENIIAFKARTQPASVAMKWVQPSAGQEVVFVAGKNDNKMRVKGGPFKNLRGFTSLDVNDPRVLEHSRHTIVEAGIGNLIESTLDHWEKERKIGKTQVKVSEVQFDNRVCLRVETIRTEKHKDFYAARSVIYLDKDSKLPIRNENYDWPRAGGPAEGDLLEVFNFINLRFNVGLTDTDFNK